MKKNRRNKPGKQWGFLHKRKNVYMKHPTGTYYGKDLK